MTAKVTAAQGLAGHRRPVPLSAQLSGEVLKEFRNGSSLLSITAFCVGAATYDCLFFRSRLISRWLSAWGIAGVALGFVAAIVCSSASPGSCRRRT